MSKTVLPAGYKSALSVHDTQIAIGSIKYIFNKNLCKALNLSRVSAPLFVDASTGFNDDLNGVERAVAFDIKETGGVAQVVHSLAKWKRYALYKYGFSAGEGIVTDMNAIRRDEEMDNIHSIYVDQWDWEKVISREQRNVDFLKETVDGIVGAICDTFDKVKESYPAINVSLNRQVKYITTYELEALYPDMTSKQRENAIAKEYGTVFLMQIGDVLASGEKHDGRAPDYDDWTLNGDLLFYNEVLGCAFEISSMGIRVDADALRSQLDKAGCPERAELMFHSLLLDGTLPLTMGGGIGQSRLCMLMLGKAHIGEVQVSVWDDETARICRENGIELL